jgi:predicted membrane GTPase involved in stress response
MACVVIFDAFWKQTFAATLPPSRKSGATALRFHAGAKTMLAFPCPFRGLIGPFHLAMCKAAKGKSRNYNVNVRYESVRAPHVRHFHTSVTQCSAKAPVATACFFDDKTR